MSALRDAMKAVKSDIVTVPFAEKAAARPHKRYDKPAQVVPLRPKLMINGHEVRWAAQEGSSQKIPYIQTDKFYVQYPSKADDIKLPEGTKMANYNKAKRRVEFFDDVEDGKEPIRYVNDAKHEPLPVPKFMSDLERVEEIFEINFETGEVINEMRIDILPEGTHWKLRLQEFETQQKAKGVSDKAINFRLQKYLKNLEAIRGVTVQELAAPIPQAVLDAIEFSETKQRAAVGGKA
jgi:hypothetical protein